MLLENYMRENFYDEMFDEQGNIRSWYQMFNDKINDLDSTEILSRQHAAERAFMLMGATFNVYSEGEGIEKILPFDIIPRIINHTEWTAIDQGLQQRIRALNLFIHDIYNDQKIIKDKGLK